MAEGHAWQYAATVKTAATDLTLPHREAGRLQSVMADWCPLFPWLHADYPSRRQSSRALNLVIEAIRMCT